MGSGGKPKYGVEEGGWYTWGNYGVELWKDIRNEASLLTGYCGFAIVDGRRVCFWDDFWYGTSPLCVTFSSLYNVTASKGGWVADF